MNKLLQRDSSFELLRLILMFLIVFHHAITHGLGLDSFASWSNRSLLIQGREMNLYLSLNNLGIFAVNAFVIISGFFGIKATWRKALTILLCVLFYTVLFSAFPAFISGDYSSCISSLLFISHTPYWFITDYLILMLFSPVINKAYDELDEKTLKVFTLGVLSIAIYLGFIWGNEIDRSGYNFYHFIVLYAIVRALSKGWINFSTTKSIVLFVGALLLNMFFACILYKIGHNELVWKTTYYSNPLLIIAATALVLYFRQLSFRSSVINFFASSALGIYLFQNTDLISQFFYETVGLAYNGGGFKALIIIVLYSLGLCVVAITIDKLRDLAFKGIQKIFNRRKEQL